MSTAPGRTPARLFLARIAIGLGLGLVAATIIGVGYFLATRAQAPSVAITRMLVPHARALRAKPFSTAQPAEFILNRPGWSEMDSLANSDWTTAKTVAKSNTLPISRYVVSRPLQLTLSPDAASTTSAPGQSSQPVAATSGSVTVPGFSSTGEGTGGVQPQKLTEDQQLFNGYTGFRGFMAQNWINKNVGLQGGFAIPKEQVRNGQESLRDQMAVGMGLLVNF